MKLGDYQNQLAEYRRDYNEARNSLEKESKENLRAQKKLSNEKIDRLKEIHHNDKDKIEKDYELKLSKNLDHALQEKKENDSDSKSRIEKVKKDYDRRYVQMSEDKGKELDIVKDYYNKDLSDEKRKASEKNQKLLDRSNELIKSSGDLNEEKLGRIEKAKTQTIDHLSDKFNKKLSELHESYGAKIQNLTQDKNVSLEKLIGESRENKQRLESEYMEGLKKSQRDADNKALVHERDHQKVLGHTQNKADRVLNKVNTEFRDEKLAILNDAKSKISKESESVRNEYAKKLLTATKNFDYQMQQKDQDLSEVKSKYERMFQSLNDKMVKDLEQSNRSNEERLKVERQAMQNYLSRKENESQRQIRDLRINFDGVIQKVKDQNESQTVKLRDNYETQISSLKEQSKRDLQQLKRESDANYLKLAHESERTKESLIDYYENRIDSLKSNYEKSELKNKLEHSKALIT